MIDFTYVKPAKHRDNVKRKLDTAVARFAKRYKAKMAQAERLKKRGQG